MSERHFPVRPNLEQFKHQAKDLLHAVKKAEPAAVAELQQHSRTPIEPKSIKLADAQHALARSYGIASWPRLVLACRMTDAICRDDVDKVRNLILKNPNLLHEMARGTQSCNWGPPMSFAANLGRDRIIAALREMGAQDLQHAFDRACLQSRIDTARKLFAMGARPAKDAVMGPCETQSYEGLRVLLEEWGAAIDDGNGNRLRPAAMILETYCRNPGKYACLELLAKHGIDLPDTPPMAVHRGRIDLLEQHLKRDPKLLSRMFSHREIYPPELDCHQSELQVCTSTPPAGGSLLHITVEYDEMEIARWLIDHGIDVNLRADVNAEGFGGHTALFGCVVSQAYACGKQQDAAFTRLLLDHGADPNARATLRKRLMDAEDDTMHEYPDVTPLSWGERFHDHRFVNRAAMQLIAERGGRP